MSSPLPPLSIAWSDVALERPEPGVDPDERWTLRNTEDDALGWSWPDARLIHIPRLATYRFEVPRWRVDATAEPGVPEADVTDAYYRAVLPLFLQSESHEVLHASAVIAGGAVVGFCAVSGTGKSTLATNLSRLGRVAWSDDALAWSESGGQVFAEGLPFRLRLNGEGPRPMTGPSHPLPLRALLVLERDSSVARPELRRAEGSDGFRAILPHAYCFAHTREANQKLVEQYARLAALVPLYHLRFNPQPPRPDELAAFVDSLLDMLSLDGEPMERSAC